MRINEKHQFYQLDTSSALAEIKKINIHPPISEHHGTLKSVRYSEVYIYIYIYIYSVPPIDQHTDELEAHIRLTYFNLFF